MDFNALDDAHTTDDAYAERRLKLAAVLFAAVAGLAAVDVVADIMEGTAASHWVAELVVVVLGLVGLAAMIRELKKIWSRNQSLARYAEQLSGQLAASDEEARVLSEKLEMKEQEAQRWRDEAKTLLAGLGEAIDSQFGRWNLTRAEKEVALLLLKGLSHKEVASVRGTSDATARQQARAVYAKGGLSGRNDLSAFFLEDLLLPMATGPEGSGEHPDN
jgi:DNA-binding CsgD family transcriptional regulator